MKKIQISDMPSWLSSVSRCIAYLGLSAILVTTAQAGVNSKKADYFYMMVNNQKIELGDSLDDVERQLGIAHNRSGDQKTKTDSLSWWFDNGVTLVTVFKEAKNNNQNNSSYEPFKPIKPFKPKLKNPIKTASPEIIDVLGYGQKPKTIAELEAEISKVIADRNATNAKIAASQKSLKKITPPKILSEIIISSSTKIKDSYLVAYGEKINLNTESVEQLETKFGDAYRCLSYFEQGKLGWIDFTVRDGKGKNYYANFSTINNSQYSLTSIEGLLDTKKKLVDSLSLSQGLENHSTEVYCKDWYER